MVRRLRYVVVCCSVLIALEARAQNGGLRGAVVDENNQPLAGVEVLLEPLGVLSREVRLESDANGTFVRVGIRLGQYRLTIQKEGYQTYSEEIKIPPGSPMRIDVILRSVAARRVAESEEEAEELKLYFDQGVAEVEAENYPAALAAFEQVLELKPDSATAYFNLGVVYRKMGETEKAIELFSKAAEIRSDYYDAYVAIGEIYSAESRWPETLEVLSKALEAQPDSTDTLYNYGAAAMNASDFATAKESFEKLLAIDPEHAAGHYQMGMICVNQGENEAAVLHLEKYLELDPEGPQAATATGILDYLKKN